MNDKHQSVAVIIVNYGTAGLAIEAVESIRERKHSGLNVSIHLVDNNSPENDAEILAQAHQSHGWGDQVTLWPETENHGFGRGNNVVLNALDQMESPPDKVMLLNPDARLTNETVSILAQTLEENQKAASAGTLIGLTNGSFGASAFRFPSLTDEVVQTLNFRIVSSWFSHLRVPLPATHPAGAVDWVSGTAVMFRFDALRDVGFFDPEFFLYFEETELQYRLHQKGWLALFVPSARVNHEQGASTGLLSEEDTRRSLPAYLYQSKWIYFRKTRGRFRSLIAAILVLGAGVLNVVHRRVRGREPTIARRFFKDHIRFGLKHVLRWTSV